MFGFLKTIKRRNNNAEATITIYFSQDSVDVIIPENQVFYGNGLELHRHTNRFKTESLRIASVIPQDQRGDTSKILNQVAYLALSKNLFPSVAKMDVACYVCETLTGDDYHDGDICQIIIEDEVLKSFSFSRVTMNTQHLNIEEDTNVTRYF
jgi:hypothetical protein